MHFHRPARLTAALSLIVLLAACQSSEERAAEHYRNALALVEAGDGDRAIVEFRNVFRLDGDNREARLDYARLLRERGQNEGAYAQYLRVAEQYPDDIEALTALSRIAIELQGWTEARRHGRRLLELAPDAFDAEVIAVNLDYSDAIEAKDAPARREAARRAATLLESRPDDLLLMRTLIDARVLDNEFEEALALLEEAIELSPDDRLFYNTRLALLSRMGREDEIEGRLLEMRELFPDDAELDDALLRFYLSRNEADRAEAFLRDLADAAEGEARVEALANLTQFILQTRGSEPALEELALILEGADASPRLEALRAGILYETGARAEAISEMEAIIARLDAQAAAPAEEGADEETGSGNQQAGLIKVALARMLVEEGNPVGARRLVEEVLAKDESQVEALRMKAAWLIEEDKADEAIALLRSALDQRPDDVQALTLTALAHARNGNADLSREFLSLAVESSGNAPAESIRYASALMDEGRFLPAEEVVIRSLRLSRNNLDLLETLGRIYFGMEDWARVGQIEDQLRRISEDAAVEEPARERAALSANALQARRLGAQGRVDDAIAFLEELAASGEGEAIDAQIAVVRARLASGQGEAAVEYAKAALAEDPENTALAFTLAATQGALGRYDEAEAGYRDLLAQGVNSEQIWLSLVRVLNAKGDFEGAQDALAEGLEVLPEGMDLLWAQASFLERAGDIDGAIAIYEQLRERAPNSDLVINNLASLLSTTSDDPEVLARVERMARRLRGTEVPAFQDTYGWIAYRSGDLDAALAHLEPAAAALIDDPMVQYHLGMTYAGLDRPEDALEKLRLAVDMSETPTASYVTSARTEIERIEAELAEETQDDTAATGQ
ncbi:tetratricopeptide repeat protein [Jannaschia seosinensis]|uniref:Tetratricopeptide repeat protein n=1 Tax=Jannaschia seosinensis TaxID=313367 RepID=A0A0M7B948_9RHOB|nr:tetratricopeptide repeat protein [Jannaschia seosinensis]CUH21423.1 tetratricopeptide repeat protein [Jannaschia seosinensis]